MCCRSPWEIVPSGSGGARTKASAIPAEDARLLRESRLLMAHLARTLQGMTRQKNGKRGMTGKHQIGRVGALSNSWRGGRLQRHGYVVLWVGHAHPMADSKGYVAEHRLVVSQFIGRPLTSAEIVHHINGAKTDNRIENLELTDRRNHIAEHRDAVTHAMKESFRSIVANRRPPTECASCGVTFTPPRAPRCKRTFCSRECAFMRSR